METFRALGLPQSIQKHLPLLEWQGKYREADYIESFVSVFAWSFPFICLLPLPGNGCKSPLKVKTLAVRMKEHGQNALRIAKYLEGHSRVKKVYCPGLKSHPQHELTKKQESGFGGMISFEIDGGLEEAERFLENLNIFALAESLGDLESLIEHPAKMTHASIPREMRERVGITDSLIRVSVGLENCDDLVEDLEQAFHKIT